MDHLRAALETLPIPLAFAALLAENLLIFALALAAGAIGLHLFASRRVAEVPDRLTRAELLFAAVTILLNTAVTLAGLYLYRAGIIRFRTDVGLRVLLDLGVLLLVMDALMYVLHRAAHHPILFSLVHSVHHRYERVRPLTLFVLHPVETLSFGGLWLALLYVYPPSWLGMSIYLALNVAFGIIGHMGVEPLPDRVRRLPGLRLVAMAGFHAAHHRDSTINYGFYTTIWDRLFRSLEEGAARRGEGTEKENAGR
ncbi:MAG TPA: sterol desaturase family protein [Polyangiaceae bacterium]|nr:sterol desaturase family protein [Polyangiaceae bacterium]